MVFKAQYLSDAWGFSNAKYDTSMFIFHNSHTLITFFIYVDDIIVTGNSSAIIQHFIICLNIHFALKDLGDLSFFFGIQVARSSNHLHLFQSKYIHSLLERAQLNDCKPIHSPKAVGASLSLTDGQSLDNPSEYRSLVGALQYCTLTRPNISFSVNKLCQFMHAPTTSHLQAAKRLIRHLKGTNNHGILLTKSPVLALTYYTDADWASCQNDRRSTNGFCVFLGSILISWSFSKQKVVSRSSAESEYCGLSNVAAEVLWIQSVLTEIDVNRISTPSTAL
ncbi:uncharacterized mitochondrial protein AtMg00810-like [Benincasa hispida]|uniref:uncharacterized mitochondrial protein AtMg00810-like n=1 Tax=Benincasa hispida TaxID=102211 RepID=UPI0018FF9714|nr:uncharacterized mitochondrial protein AtMg00810-like [Benincasa hispida]